MWHDRTQVKKGDVGEALVDAFLKSRNVVPYQPVFDGAHPFDRLLATADKKTLYVADVKTKARRTYYPDTGIDVRHYNEYLHIQEKHNLQVFLFFVDEEMQLIYGGWLSKLIQERHVLQKNKRVVCYPLTQAGIIYFPLNAMHRICKIDDSSAAELRRLSTRSYDYQDEEEA